VPEVLEEEGGYVTRGRVAELLGRMAELDRDVDERLGKMERRIDELAAFEHELLRRRLAVELELLRTYQTVRRGT
jgi:hypothetical protein